MLASWFGVIARSPTDLCRTEKMLAAKSLRPTFLERLKFLEISKERACGSRISCRRSVKTRV